MRVVLEDALAARSVSEWERLFTEAGVPVGPVLSVPEVLAHPQIEERQLIKNFEHVPGIDRGIAVLLAGFRLSGEQPGVMSPPPQLGQDTSSILSELGYETPAIEALRRDGVI